MRVYTVRDGSHTFKPRELRILIETQYDLDTVDVLLERPDAVGDKLGSERVCTLLRTMAEALSKSTA